MSEYVFHPYPRWITGADGVRIVVHDDAEDCRARGLEPSPDLSAAVQAIVDDINAVPAELRGARASTANDELEAVFATDAPIVPRRRGRPPKNREA